MDQAAVEVMRALPRIGAFKLGTFPLTLHDENPSALLSPFYIDLRVIRSYPTVLANTARAISTVVRPLAFDRLADVPTAATPIVAAMVIQNEWPMISPRMDEKKHGSGAEIDGSFPLDCTAVVIDDLVTQATSKLRAIKKLKDNGIFVKHVAVFLDRQQGGREELAKAGYELHSAATVDDLLKCLLVWRFLSHEAQEIISRYRSGELRSGWEKTVKEGWDRI